MTPFGPHLAPRAANHTPLSPLDLLERTVEANPDGIAVIWNDAQWTWRAFASVIARMAEMLRERGIGRGDVVSVMAANRPELLAAHFAVPAVGAVLNAINTRLDTAAVAHILRHAQSRLILTDAVNAPVAEPAATETPLAILDTLDLLHGEDTPLPNWREAVTDEWQPLALNYTSGTTGEPKGVVYHHRGAYLNALGNVIALGLTPRSVYLWTLPMFHCNGWCHTWTVTAAGGTHVCLDRPDPTLIFRAIEAHTVTHMACAPVVLTMLMNHPERPTLSGRTTVVTGGASPTSALIAQLDTLGFDLLHMYGLTESYGPATICELTDEQRSLGIEDRAHLLARQGRRHITAGRVGVIDDSGAEVAANGETMGEIVLAGNTLMAGYAGDADATDAAYHGGWLHTGDLAVRHLDGQIEIRDRSKDIIISGGENISSLEVESVLHRHASVMLAAVVAQPDDTWGEIPCAFIEAKPGETPDPDALDQHCRAHLPGFKVPRRYVFQDLPKTATGKIQKFELRAIAREDAHG